MITKAIQVPSYKEDSSCFQRFYKFLVSERLKHSGPPKDQDLEEYCKEINEALDLPSKIALKPQDLVLNKPQKELFKSIMGLSEFSNSNFSFDFFLIFDVIIHYLIIVNHKN